MDIRLFDNYEEDGQLSLFGFDEPEAEIPDGAAAGDGTGTDGAAAPGAAPQKASAGAGLRAEETVTGVRIQRCSSCGKLLYVRGETDGYAAVCNNCGIRYFQKGRAI